MTFANAQHSLPPGDRDGQVSAAAPDEAAEMLQGLVLELNRIETWLVAAQSAVLTGDVTLLKSATRHMNVLTRHAESTVANFRTQFSAQEVRREDVR